MSHEPRANDQPACAIAPGMEALYYAMRAGARATWSTIKHIDGIEPLNKKYQQKYEQGSKK